ncbi:MAG: polymer-forming cytoskeletal protein [Betaproteobacteria bacterium]
MALQPPFFGKRDPDPAAARRAQTMAQLNAQGAPSTPVTGVGVAPGAAAVTPPAETPAAVAGSDNAKAQGGSTLTVGPNIKLKGVEITDCDTLVVEGMVEATMDSRLMQIAECGAFKGSACIDIAEIHGNFDGDLTVRDKLMIYATGKITGKVRYGKLVIEEGGQLSGEVIFGTTDKSRPATVQRAGLQAA